MADILEVSGGGAHNEEVKWHLCGDLRSRNSGVKEVMRWSFQESPWNLVCERDVGRALQRLRIRSYKRGKCD